MIELIAIMALFGPVTTNSGDSTFFLRYDLSVGTSYTYRIITDQFILQNSAARLHSKLRLDVINRDESSNLHCKLELTADTLFKENQKALLKSTGKLTFSGNKMYSGVGFLDLLFDEFGHIIRSRHVMSDIDSTDVSQTSSQRTMDAGPMGAAEDYGPYGVNLVIPQIPSTMEIVPNRQYVDTILFSSRIVHMPTNYGTSATSERKLYYDTLIRTSILDSTCIDEQGYMFGYMTLKGERRNAFGARFQMSSFVMRDMRSGLITYVTEECNYLRKGIWEPYYKVEAELIQIRRLPTRN